MKIISGQKQTLSYTAQFTHNKNYHSADKMSRVGANSAYEINIGIVVHPCDQCKAEADSIKSAVSTLLKLTTN